MNRHSRLPRQAGLILGMAGLLLGSATASAQAQTQSAEGLATEPGNGNTPSEDSSPGVSTVPTADTVPNASPEPSGGYGTGGSSTDTSPGAHPSDTYTVVPSSTQPQQDQHPLLHDIEAYYTSPLHWDGKDWAYFGGAMALLAASHHYDTQVRNHFVAQGAKPLGGSTDDLKDAVPMIGAVVGTWAYASYLGNSDGFREAWNMVEAGGLSVVDSYALKIVAGRERPDQTSDPNKWRKSGSSFPSIHAAGAFAIGSILAESGNDDYRWIRRFLGYGAVASYTAFERLKHNAHWLSDDVAGAEIGGATAHFVLERSEERREARDNYSISLVPVQGGGAMLTFNLTIK
jgi:membrane-associated phospholipid phosphatase